jgi:hypothetical protein
VKRREEMTGGQVRRKNRTGQKKNGEGREKGKREKRKEGRRVTV